MKDDDIKKNKNFEQADQALLFEVLKQLKVEELADGNRKEEEKGKDVLMVGEITLSKSIDIPLEKNNISCTECVSDIGSSLNDVSSVFVLLGWIYLILGLFAILGSIFLIEDIPSYTLLPMIPLSISLFWLGLTRIDMGRAIEHDTNAPDSSGKIRVYRLLLREIKLRFVYIICCVICLLSLLAYGMNQISKNTSNVTNSEYSN